MQAVASCLIPQNSIGICRCAFRGEWDDMNSGRASSCVHRQENACSRCSSYWVASWGSTTLEPVAVIAFRSCLLFVSVGAYVASIIVNFAAARDGTVTLECDALSSSEDYVVWCLWINFSFQPLSLACSLRLASDSLKEPDDCRLMSTYWQSQWCLTFHTVQSYKSYKILRAHVFTSWSSEPPDPAQGPCW